MSDNLDVERRGHLKFTKANNGSGTLGVLDLPGDSVTQLTSPWPKCLHPKRGSIMLLLSTSLGCCSVGVNIVGKGVLLIFKYQTILFLILSFFLDILC